MIFTYEVEVLGFDEAMNGKFVATMEVDNAIYAVEGAKLWVKNLVNTLKDTDASIVMCGQDDNFVEVKIHHAIHGWVHKDDGGFRLTTNMQGGRRVAIVYVDVTTFEVVSYG